MKMSDAVFEDLRREVDAQNPFSYSASAKGAS
jgi:hypothetical protein